MQWLDLTLPTPAENLACDEALLDLCETGEMDEAVRFWESTAHVIVVGYGNRVEVEVDTAACRAANIGIYRRCTGGGAVLQGPGCLNYSLVLAVDSRPELESITSANRHIMKRNCAALSKLLGTAVSVEGHTDLVLNGRKFSGNSQRRKRTHLLFHGTFLLVNFDLKLIPRYLRAPSREPDYRKKRSHLEFLAGIAIAPEQIKTALRQEWDAGERASKMPDDRLKDLVGARYSRSEWNLRF
ncbi:MAG: lipoate--protein ligase family protein [Verrucomicrobia subdivision 3 bacterium]|nr:lipoate--protein ligase family protein [Limisphaerales bacterium]